MRLAAPNAYVVAILLAIASVLARFVTDPILGERAPFGLALVAVLIAAWYGGVGPALITVLLSIALSTYFFLEPRGSVVVLGEERSVLMVSLILAVMIAVLSGSLQAAHAKAARHAQEASQRGELLRVTLASIGDGVISTDAAGHVLFLNTAAQSLTGFSQDTAAGQPLVAVFRLTDPDSIANIQSLIAATASKDMPGKPLSPAVHRYSTGALLARGGGLCDVEYDLAPIHEASGAVAGFVLAVRDVSQRKRAEETLQFLTQSSIELSDSLDLASRLDRVVRLPAPKFADWCVVEVLDPSWSESSTWIRACAHRDPVWDARLRETLLPGASSDAPLLVAEDAAPMLVTDLTDWRRAGLAVDPELQARLADLEPRCWILAPLVYRRERLGTLLMALGAAGRHDSGDDLQWVDEFARRAAAAIENARLYRRALEADRRKDEFLAILSHELRNPLGVLHNALFLMRSTKMPEGEAEQTLEMMDIQQQQLKRLVDDLLEVSRITRGRIVLRRERLDFGQLVARVVKAMRPLIAERRHELSISLPDAATPVEGDGVRLTQAIENLLNNAAKYTEVGGHIWLRVELHDAEVWLRVRDNGLGIAPEMLDRVFGPFTQGASENHPHGGLGIGLALARKLIEMHGGGIRATSPGPGKGSEFIIRLPLARIADPHENGQAGPLPSDAVEMAPAAAMQDADAARTHEPRAEEIPAAEAGSEDIGSDDAFAEAAGSEIPVDANSAFARNADAARPRVLVIDDNQASGRTLARLLRSWNFEVEATFDPFMAIEIAQRFHPHWALLDIGMPRLNGYELARQLRAGDGQIRLVAITGYGREEDRRRSREAGIAWHFTKPIDPEELQRLLAAESPFSAT